MAYRKRSLDLPLPPGQAQASKHPRSTASAALPPIRSLTEIAAHSEHRLPSLLQASSARAGPASDHHPAPSSIQVGPASEHPATRTGDPSLSLAAIRVSSPGNPEPSAQHPLQAPLSAPAMDTVKVARNWSRDETLSLVRAIGRHYESLKRCKTNQERSNVWHRIHKEHSSQFPGRSKKASQDRWGKVLSDYKDVMVHNKEKGAARWTFDFFKEVAAIVEGDVQFMELTTSPPLFSPQPVPSRHNSDDLGAYSFGGANPRMPPPSSTTPHSAGPPPPPQHHRMSEPNLPHMHPAHHAYQSNYSMLRSQPASSSSFGPQKLSPIELCPATSPEVFTQPSSDTRFSQQGDTRFSQQGDTRFSQQSDTRLSQQSDSQFSPSRRTSYPQMQAHAMAASAATAPAYARTPTGNADGKSFNYQRHSIQVLSPPPAMGGSSMTSSAISYARGTPVQHAQAAGIATPGGQDSPSVRFSPSEAEPEKACRYVLDMLETQVRRIDVQQETLAQLRTSTQDAITQVEQVLQRYTRPR
ncbi:hypothetical protein GGF43_000397 [Coemansia sp. RSA 2618]|nr:hypothetical protein GGF43_000397 [Coemansia sp. RSA 2618]